MTEYWNDGLCLIDPEITWPRNAVLGLVVSGQAIVLLLGLLGVAA